MAKKTSKKPAAKPAAKKPASKAAPKPAKIASSGKPRTKSEIMGTLM
jgi:hypothetical protein